MAEESLLEEGMVMYAIFQEVDTVSGGGECVGLVDGGPVHVAHHHAKPRGSVSRS